MNDSLNNQDLSNADLRSLTLLLYLMPIFGVGPALWTLSRPNRPRQERALSRMVIKLALIWFASTVLLEMGVEGSQTLKLPLLVISSLVTSGYFVLNLGLMLRLWQRRSITLPGIGAVSRIS
ncbi:MAG: hypothetical protein VKJ24_16775 [Synechococcales bacterium]|nr:hypothetical protein [Synechococcales bacterium]